MTDETLASRKEILNTKLRSWQSFDIDNDSNFKFMNLLRSRLNEEGIPLEAATQIVANLDYDLSAVNEDDDYIGDVALAYSEHAVRIYTRLKATNWHRNLTDAVVRKFFGGIKVNI